MSHARLPASPSSRRPAALLAILTALLALGAASTPLIAAPQHTGLAQRAESPTAGSPGPPLAVSASLPHGGEPVPYVASTLELLNGTRLSGNALPLTVTEPTNGLLDASTQTLYVANTTGTLAVVDLQTEAVTAVLPVGETPAALALDPATGQLYVANNGSGSVTVIATGSLRVAGTIPVGANPLALAIDTDNNTLFVANAGSDNVTVIDLATGMSVANISVGAGPTGLVYEPNSDRVFVADALGEQVTVLNASSYATVAATLMQGTPGPMLFAPLQGVIDVSNSSGSNVWVLNGTTGAAQSRWPAGSGPGPLALDTDSDELFVGNQHSFNVTVRNQSTGTLVGSVPLISTPYGLSYDSVNDQVYIAEPGSARIGAIDVANLSIEATIKTCGALETNLPAFLEVDPANGLLYDVNRAEAWSYFGDNITLVNPTTDRPTASIPLSAGPSSAALDLESDELFVVAPNTGYLFVVNASTDTLVTRVYVGVEPTAAAYDEWNGDVYIADFGDGNVTVLNATSLHLVTRIFLGGLPIAITFDPVHGFLYVADQSTGDIWVLNGTTNHLLGTIPTGAFRLSAITYDPATGRIYGTDSVAGELLEIDPIFEVLLGTLAVGGSPSAIAYDPVTGDLAIANTGSGNLSIVNPLSSTIVTNATVPNGPGLTADPWLAGLVSADQNTDLVGGVYDPGDSPLPAVPVGGGPAGAQFDAEDASVFVENGLSGTLSEIEQTAAPRLFPVDVHATGVPGNSSWAVDLAGVYSGTTGNDIGAVEPNGTVAFSIVPPAGDVATPENGSILVDGALYTLDIAFSPIPVPEYLVTFAENGLPSGDSWNVTLGGVLGTAVAPNPVEFNETNGLYNFAVGAIRNYTASPTAGVATVQGEPLRYTIRWTGPPPVQTPLTATLNLSSNNLTLGDSFTATTVATGGDPPYSYSYLVLPPGCTGGNVSSINCTPNATGDWHVTISVSDTGGHTFPIGAAVSVASTPGEHSPRTNSGSGASWLTSYWWVIVLVAAVAVIGAIVVVVARRRQGGGRSMNDEPAEAAPVEEGSPSEATELEAQPPTGEDDGL